MNIRNYFIFLLLLAVTTSSYAEGRPIIDGDKVWEYVTIERKVFSNNYIRYQFDKFRFGEEIEKYGRLYREWIHVESDKYYRNDYLPENQWQHIPENPNSVQAYLREEDGRVYMLLDREEVGVYDDEFSLEGYIPEKRERIMRNVEEGEEVILYDFSCPVNSYYQGIWCNSVLTPVVVTDYDCLTNLDQQYKCMTMSFLWEYSLYIATFFYMDLSEKEMFSNFLDTAKLSAIEGIGVVRDGTLTDFSGPELIYATNGNTRSDFLNNVYSPEGRILFEGENLLPPPQLSEVIENSFDQNYPQPLFDLYGNIVKTPIPGSIYIRNGKKILY